MKRFHTRLILSVGLIASLGLPAIAAPGPVSKIDTNGDNQVDKVEFLAAANNRFTSSDLDADGLVTKEERHAFRVAQAEERAKERFSKMDENGDGTVSESEFSDALGARKDKMREHHDMNDDGVVDELDHEIRKDRANVRKEGRKERAHKRGERHKFEVDANSDGFVDMSENMAAAEHAFARMDKNEDGVLSGNELRRRKGPGRRNHHGFGR